MTCEFCKKEIITEQVVIYDRRNQAVVEVLNIEADPTELHKISQTLSRDFVVCVGEPYFELQGKYYHERCYRLLLEAIRR